jgi:hypothetical protein
MITIGNKWRGARDLRRAPEPARQPLPDAQRGGSGHCHSGLRALATRTAAGRGERGQPCDPRPGGTGTEAESLPGLLVRPAALPCRRHQAHHRGDQRWLTSDPKQERMPRRPAARVLLHPRRHGARGDQCQLKNDPKQERMPRRLAARILPHHRRRGANPFPTTALDTATAGSASRSLRSRWAKPSAERKPVEETQAHAASCGGPAGAG